MIEWLNEYNGILNNNENEPSTAPDKIMDECHKLIK